MEANELRIGNWVLVVLEYFDDSNLYLTTHEGHRLSCPILYVHQLQNLYFALTGEELTERESK